MTRFHLSTVLTPVVFALFPLPALAATTIGSATTTPVATSTTGDVEVNGTGSITVTGSPAITVDTSNNATVDSGGVLTANASNNSGGILVNPGVTSTISNAGTISVIESYTAPVITGTTTADGAIANTTGRYGIRVNGAGSGSITNSGTITVKGLNAAGILLGGTYTGSIVNSGTVYVKGDGGIGIGTQAVNGSMIVGGSVVVVGQGAQDLVTAGDITGQLNIQGALSQATSYTTDSGTTQVLSAGALQSGKAAVEVDGNVTGGILLYTLCSPTTVSSVNSCTVTTTTSATTGTAGTGTIAAVGSSPALQIGGASNITIGAGAASIDGNTYSLAVDGGITATAGYASTDASAVVIGGQGGNVSMPGGIGVTGTISATSFNATATGVLINAGSTVTSLTNSGTIRATLTQAGDVAAYGIRDLSGTLTTITNHGVISATAAATSNAIDLAQNTSGVTITQSLTPYETAEQAAEQAAAGYTLGTAKMYATITGNIVTGTGNDVVNVSTGLVTGSAYLGGGNDTLNLSNDAIWTGDVHYGTGTGTMTMSGTSTFTGAVSAADQAVALTINGSAAFRGTGTTGTSNLAVTVNGGSFGAGAATTLQVGTLTVNSGGAINAYIDGSTGTSSLIQAGTATFATGAKVSATVSSLASATGTYQILTAGTLAGNPTFDATTTDLPVLFKGSVTTSGNALYLTIDRKAAAELGLTSSEAAGYNAIYANAVLNTSLGSSLLQVADVATLQGQMDQLLPDHAGGVFDYVTRASRLAARHITDDSSLFSVSPVDGWLEPIYFHGGKDATGTAAYTDHGFGLTGGMERRTGIGYIGGSFTWVTGKILDGTWQDIKANSFEGAAHWRMSSGPLYAYARLSVGHGTFSSTRTFTGAVDDATLTYSTAGRWSGWWLSGTGGVSYKVPLGSSFSLKPMATLDWYRLHENGYAEAGATPIDLTVGARTSTEASLASTLTASWSLGGRPADGSRPLTIELEGGRRTQIGGTLGATTASFDNGTAFTITPESLQSGWLGEARILMGGFDYTWQFTAGAERVNGLTDYSGRISFSLAL